MRYNNLGDRRLGHPSSSDRKGATRRVCINIITKNYI
jgi:hypothetical protein